jgi:hypothetical protein
MHVFSLPGIIHRPRIYFVGDPFKTVQTRDTTTMSEEDEFEKKLVRRRDLQMRIHVQNHIADVVPPEVTRTTDLPPDLGLDLIRGPLRYLFMEPVPELVGRGLPALVMLGDMHVPEYCKLSCPEATCVSAQDRTHNTFLQYLDTKYGHLTPDVYLESWTTKEERLGTDIQAHTSSDYKQGALQNFILNILPCTAPDKMLTIDSQTIPCPYSNLRAHVADVRSISLGSVIINDIVQLRSSPSALAALWAKQYPGFSPPTIMHAVINQSPAKFFEDPLYIAHSRVTHELKQLDPALRTELLRELTSRAAIDDDFLLPEAEEVLRWLGGATSTELNPRVVASLALAGRMVVQKSVCILEAIGMDLYTIARIFKPRKAPERGPALAVLYMGDKHVSDIAHFLRHMYMVRMHVPSIHRCIFLRRRQLQTVPTLSADVETYRGDTVRSEGEVTHTHHITQAIAAGNLRHVADVLARRTLPLPPAAVKDAVRTGNLGIVRQVLQSLPPQSLDVVYELLGFAPDHIAAFLIDAAGARRIARFLGKKGSQPAVNLLVALMRRKLLTRADLVTDDWDASVIRDLEAARVLSPIDRVLHTLTPKEIERAIQNSKVETVTKNGDAYLRAVWANLRKVQAVLADSRVQPSARMLRAIVEEMGAEGSAAVVRFLRTKPIFGEGPAKDSLDRLESTETRPALTAALAWYTSSGPSSKDVVPEKGGEKWVTDRRWVALREAWRAVAV